MRAALCIVLGFISLMFFTDLKAQSFTTIDESEIQISSINLELDTEWPDSIFYWDPQGAPLYWNGIGYWAGHKFTAPADFTLQAVRLKIYNQYHIDSSAEVWIMHHDEVADQPGDDYFNHACWSGPTLEWGWNECEFAEENYINLTEGEVFWIVYGPAPGGNHNNPDTGWWPLFSNPGTTTDSKTTSAANRHGNYFNRGLMHLNVTALGELAPYSDPALASVNNNLDKFFYFPGDTVRFEAILTNNGTLPTSDFDLRFVVHDTLGFELFNNVVNVNSLDAEATIEISASVDWIPQLEGYFLVSGEIENVQDDADLSNNSSLLMQKTINSQNPCWYAYDDGVFESSANFADLNGIGAGFKPAAYPAQVDSVAWWFSGTEIGEIVYLKLYHYDDITGIMSLVWQNQHPILENGWIAYRVFDDNSDPITLQRGTLIAVCHADLDGTTFSRDINEPISAANSGMHSVGYRFHESPSPASDGNRGIRALIGPGAAPSLSFPSESLDFGTVSLGASATAYLQVINNGNGVGIIDSLLIGQSEITYVGDWPFVIQPESQANMQFDFTPSENTTLGQFQGAFRLWHNDLMSLQNPLTVLCNADITTTADVSDQERIPSQYFLDQNFPNPFNSSTRINFGLKQQGYVRLEIYNVKGQLVETLINGFREAGFHSITLQAEKYSSGIYFCSIQSREFKTFKKMVLIK